jgi:hypothetical protein
MTTSIVTPAMSRKAEQLAALLPTFSRGRSKASGQPFYVVPSSNRLSAHWTAIDGSGCTCQGHQRRGTCTHSIAAADVHKRQQPTRIPTSLIKTYDELYPPCRGGCGDLADTRDQLCDRCASTREYEQRMASRQTARVVEAWL